MKPRLVIIVKYFYPIRRPSGISSFVFELAKRLASEFDLHVISLQYHPSSPHRIESHGMTIHKVPRPFPWNAGRAAKILRPDHLLVFSGVTTAAASFCYFGLIRLLSKSPHAVFVQANHYTRPPSRRHRLFRSFFQSFVGTHPSIADALSEAAGKKATSWIPPGINLSWLDSVEPVLRNNNKIRIGFFGHFYLSKGVDRLLNVFKELHPQDNIELVVGGGDGPLSNFVHERANKTNNIRCFMFEKNIHALMKSCDLVVLPYRSSEKVLGISQTLLEVMAMRIPCIVTETPALSSVIIDGVNGLLVRSDSELREKIQELITMTDRRKTLGIGARQTIEQKFRIEDIAKQYKQIFERQTETNVYYDRYSSWYDSERTRGYYELINDREVDCVRMYGSGKRILEVGCGTGILLKRVAEFAKEAVGVDPSEGMLDQSRKKGLEVIRGSATALPFPDESFDVVYSFKVLPHIEDIREAILEIFRVLRPSGVAILEFYNSWSMKRWTNPIYNWWKKRYVFLRFDSPRRIRRYLPPKSTILKTRGIKIFSIANSLFQKPMIHRLERLLADSPLKYFGGYVVIAVQKESRKE